MSKHQKLFWGILWAVTIAIVVHRAHAEQSYLAPAETLRNTATCTFAGGTPKNVTTTGTSAATSTTVARGNIRVVCSTLSYMAQGAYGSTGATATTGGLKMIADAPEYFYNPGNNYIAFIRDSSSGVCQVAECK